MNNHEQIDPADATSSPASPRLVNGEGSTQVSRSRRRFTWWIVGAAGLLIAVTLAIVLPLALAGGPHLRGMVTFFSLTGSVRGAWDECGGTGDLSGLTSGAPVRVRDGSGSVIGFAELRNLDAGIVRDEVQGLIQRKAPGWEAIAMGDLDTQIEGRINDLNAATEIGSCSLYFEIPVPRSDYLTVEVGERQVAELGAHELESQDWWIWVDAPLSLEEMTGVRVD